MLLPVSCVPLPVVITDPLTHICTHHFLLVINIPSPCLLCEYSQKYTSNSQFVLIQLLIVVFRVPWVLVVLLAPLERTEMM